MKTLASLLEQVNDLSQAEDLWRQYVSPVDSDLELVNFWHHSTGLMELALVDDGFNINLKWERGDEGVSIELVDEDLLRAKEEEYPLYEVEDEEYSLQGFLDDILFGIDFTAPVDVRLGFHDGALHLSTRISGILVKQSYLDYSYKEARELFDEYIKSGAWDFYY